MLRKRPVSATGSGALSYFFRSQPAREAMMKNPALYLLMVVVAAVVASFTYVVMHKNMEEGKLGIALGKTKFDMTFKDRQIEFKQVLVTALSEDKLVETSAVLKNLGYYSSSDPQLADVLLDSKQDSPIGKKIRDYAMQGRGVFQPSPLKLVITVSGDDVMPPKYARTCIGGPIDQGDLVVVGADQTRPIQLHVFQKLACQQSAGNVLQIRATDAKELLGNGKPQTQTGGYGYQTCTHPEPVLPKEG